MIDTSTPPQIDGEPRPAVMPTPHAWWLEDDTDEGSSLPFWAQVNRHRARRTYEEVRRAWWQFDELCLSSDSMRQPDTEARAKARRALHQSLERLRLATSAAY